MAWTNRLPSGGQIELTDPRGEKYFIRAKNRAVSGGVEVTIDMPSDWIFKVVPPAEKPAAKPDRGNRLDKSP